MVKKILILIVVAVGLSSMAIYETTKEEGSKGISGTYEPIVVLELFTSQGCSSCPPADILLDKVKKQYPDNVFALSYHVDYWNYIGWEDPFSNPQFSRKQREYNTKFRYSGNYTPEMVVNGREHFVGSHAGKLSSKIKEYQKANSENKVVLGEATRQDREIDFQYHIEGEVTGKLLRAVLVLDERTTVVKRGENRNRTLKNSNIVVKEHYIPLKSKEGQGSVQIPTWVKTNEKLRLVVLVENSALDITGAAKTTI